MAVAHAAELAAPQAGGFTFKVVYGLHGQLAFSYVKDLRITHFRCLDVGHLQYGVHVCTFEDLLLDDVIIGGSRLDMLGKDVLETRSGRWCRVKAVVNQR